jgi:FkbM family methyltransferase
MFKIKPAINRWAEYFGYQIIQLDNTIEQNLEACMVALLAAKSQISIIQIGANDGRINDPIYRFVTKYKDSTSVILVEPQKELIPILQQNYSKHPSVAIINSAVGKPGEAYLFSVDEKFWGEIEVPYAKNWPKYRAPTGVTSFSKEHVKAWLKKYTKKESEKVENMIVKRLIEKHTLDDLLSQNNLQRQVDILQVDAEGHDDVVIYNSISEHISPLIINLEYTNLKNDRLSKCINWLGGKGYECFLSRFDMLCTRTTYCL